MVSANPCYAVCPWRSRTSRVNALVWTLVVKLKNQVKRPEANGLSKPSGTPAGGRHLTYGWGNWIRARPARRQRVQRFDQRKARALVGDGQPRRPESRLAGARRLSSARRRHYCVK